MYTYYYHLLLKSHLGTNLTPIAGLDSELVCAFFTAHLLVDFDFGILPLSIWAGAEPLLCLENLDQLQNNQDLINDTYITL